VRAEYTKNGIGCQLKKTTIKLHLAQTRRKHQLRVEMLHNEFRDGSHVNTKLPLPGTKVINKKGRAKRPCLFPSSNYIEIYFLKNFFLPYPARPINPDPRSSMVAGSGTGATPVTVIFPGSVELNIYSNPPSPHAPEAPPPFSLKELVPGPTASNITVAKISSSNIFFA